MAGEIKGVKVDGTPHDIDWTAIANVPNASTYTAGVVKVDGTSIGVNENGQLYVAYPSVSGVSF